MSGRKASSTFSFGRREQKPVLSPAAVSILSTSFLKLLQVPHNLHFSQVLFRTWLPSANPAGRGDWKLGAHKVFKSRVLLQSGRGVGRFSPGGPDPARLGCAQHDLARRTRLHSRSLCSPHSPSVGGGEWGEGRGKDHRSAGLFIFSGLGLVFISRMRSLNLL